MKGKSDEVRMCAIIDNGEQLDVDEESAILLEERGIIYGCGACCEDEVHPAIYHLHDGYDWDDVDAALGVEVI